MTREVARAARSAAEAGAEVAGIGRRFGAQAAQIEAAEARARAEAARADTAWGVAERQNEAFRAGVFGNPRPPIGMGGYGSSTQGIPPGRPPGVPHQGGQQQQGPQIFRDQTLPGPASAVDNRGNLYVYSVSDSLGLVGTTAFNTTGAATAKAAIEKLGESNIFNRDIINEQKLVALRAALQQGLDPNSIVLTPGANGQLKQTPLATYIAENMSGPSRDLALQDLQTAQQNRGQFPQLSQAAPATATAQASPAAQPTAINVPPPQFNGVASYDLSANANQPLAERIQAALTAKEVVGSGGKLTDAGRVGYVYNELLHPIQKAQDELRALREANPDDEAKIKAAEERVKAAQQNSTRALQGIANDPQQLENLAKIELAARKNPEQANRLNNIRGTLGQALENPELTRAFTAALEATEQNLRDQATRQPSATAGARTNTQLQAALKARDEAASRIEIKAPENATEAQKTRAAALNQAYKDSLTPPAESIAGLIQTFVKMIGHAIDPNNPRFMDSDQILKLAKSGGLKIDGEEALDRANQNLATVRQGGTPAAGTPAPAAATGQGAAPVAPAAAATPAPAPATPAPAAAPAAPAAAATPAPAAGLTEETVRAVLEDMKSNSIKSPAPAADVLGERTAKLVVQYNENVYANEKLVLDGKGLHLPEKGKAKEVLARFDIDKNGIVSKQEAAARPQEFMDQIGQLSSPNFRTADASTRDTGRGAT
ncbi:MAG: hypothetical protein ACK5VZ_01685 [Alphaproteobacteria bacterium]